MEEGIYKYDPFENSLIFIIAGDFRSLAIGQAQANFDPGVKALQLFFEEKTNTEPNLKDFEVGYWNFNSILIEPVKCFVNYTGK